MDGDLAEMTREQLMAEVQRLRDGIRGHRDSSGHDLCWHHPDLWGLLPEKTDPVPQVPDWPEFMQGCVRYRQSLDELETTKSTTMSSTAANEFSTHDVTTRDTQP
jgi:hypothetical protein